MAKIVIWLGRALSSFNPLTALQDGIGGSESAAIYISRELSNLGHEVHVYADVTGQSTVVDLTPHGLAVRWHSYTSFCQANLGSLNCDLFISSRQHEAKHQLQPICRQAWLWMHDIHCGPDWENLLARDYDKILCLSDFARDKFLDYYPGVDATKVVKTSNALDLGLFPNDGYQHHRLKTGDLPFRATYSSSPDRGLDRLLGLWPKIVNLVREKYPLNHRPAELHVYYGFANWRKAALLQGQVSEMVRADFLHGKLMATPGVLYHGAVGKAELANSHRLSQMWLYPTDFLETSCITAMEAQAAGSKIVTTRCGALPETAPSAYFVDGPTKAPDYDKRFLAQVEQALGDDERGTKTMPTWAQVAKQWNGWITP